MAKSILAELEIVPQGGISCLGAVLSAEVVFWGLGCPEPPLVCASLQACGPLRCPLCSGRAFVSEGM